MEQAQVNMMAYLLGGMGEGMSPEGSFGKTAGGMAKGWAQSSQYMKLLQQMLGGMPAGSKMTGDRDSLSFKIPTGSLGFGEGLELEKPSALTPETDYKIGGGGGGGGQGVVNPFSSSLPEVSSAALAGLTVEDISKALQFKLAKEELGQKKMSDVADLLYKKGMLGVAERGVAVKESLAEGGEPLDREFPMEIPGVGKVTHRQWNSLTADQKEYAAYVHVAKKLGDADIMSPAEFKTLKPTEREQFLNAVMEDPKLMKAAKELARAGATKISISEKVETAGALADVKARKWLTDPRGLKNAMDKHMNTEAIKQELWDLPVDEKIKKTRNVKIRFIEDSIASAQGKIIGVRREGNIGIWTVEYPDKKVEEVRHAVNE